MPDPVSALVIRPEGAPVPRVETPRPEGASFREVLDAQETPERSPLVDALSGAARSISRGQRFVDRAIRSARRGRELSPEQLIATQAGVYRYTQELELASKLVDKSTSAIKQVLQSQQ